LGHRPEQSSDPRSEVFELAPAFRPRADTGGVQLGEFEAMYETLFAEVLEGGEITTEERERLDMAAAALGLDSDRVARLESALIKAWEAGIEQTLVDPDPSTLADRAPPSEAAPPPSDADPVTARDHAPTIPESFDDEGPTLTRKRAPRADDNENEQLHDRFEAARRDGDRDTQFRIAAVLVQRRDATSEQVDLYEDLRTLSPIRPARPLGADSWTQHLFHPEEDQIVGEIFAVVASAALVGRVSAMRRDGSLQKLDADKLQDAVSSTVSAVRALAWSAATLGLRTPPIYLAPEIDAGFEIMICAPPATRVGQKMLSGKSAVELAFACGRHLSWYREEHFVCTLVPSVQYLEDIFVAALHLGAPTMPLPDEVADRARIIASALAPCLEPKQIERMRRLVARFFARGGAANMKRWARAAEWTACRAGLVLCGDLEIASAALTGDPKAADRIKQLELFWASDHATALRRILGVAI
jgi:hypothetical protein